MLIFGAIRLLSLKNCQMRPQNSFLRFSLKIQLFSKKLLNKKNIQHQISDKKGYIHFWRKMTPDRSHSDTVERVEYHSSDALSAPEIFFFVVEKYRLNLKLKVENFLINQFLAFHCE